MNRILVIDDVQSNLDLMVSNLRGAGYDVIMALDGANGIKKAKQFLPDLILLDLIMPRMSGYEVCKTLKRDSETKDIIVVAVTAMATKDSRIRAFEAGVDEYLEKTFDKGVLLAKVKSLLNVKTLSDELKNNYKTLEEQNKQFAIQLEMARSVQQALISEMNFSQNGVSFASCYRPAQSVGGDMYDAVTLSAGKIAVIMADVSGHGVSAALLTSMLKIMFRNLIGTNNEAASETVPQADMLLYRMNEEFCGIFENSSVMIYACAFLAIIDTQNKVVSYSSAGSAPTLFYSKSLNAVEELQLGGKPLGLLPGSKYIAKSVYYERGDIFLFQTDGLCDSLYKEEPEVFAQKLLSLLLNEAGSSPAEIIDEALNEFFNADEDALPEKSDDVSLIVIKME